MEREKMKSLIEFIGFILFIIVLTFLLRTGCGSDEETKNKGLKGFVEGIWYGDTTTVDTVKK